MRNQAFLILVSLLSVSILSSTEPPPVPPDVPTGAAAARDAELGKQVAGIIDAFSNGSPVFTRDGKRVVFVSNRDGLPQLYVADTAKPESEASRILTTRERMTSPQVLADRKALLFRSDVGADENWSIFRTGLDGSGLVDLTPDEKLNRDDPFVPDGAPTTMFYSGRVMSTPTSTVYTQDLAPGSKPRKVYSDEKPSFLADVSRDGKRGLVRRVPSRTDNSILLLDLATGTTRALYPASGGPVQVYAAHFSGDGKTVFVTTDGGGESAILLALDASTGRETARYTETRPATAAITGLAVSKRGDRVAISLTAGDHSEVRVLDAKNLKPGPAIQLPLGSGGLGEFSEDGSRLSLTWSTPSVPGDVYVIEPSTGKVYSLRRDRRPTLASLPAVEVSIVEAKAFDGGKIPIIVYRPSAGKGDTPKKLPVIVSYHGGPAGVSTVRWNLAIRFFTSLGYAYVEPNVRGSSGFGRAYEMADNGPKRLDSFKDVEASARWVAAQPWADKDRLVVFGGSYGGYTTLIALTRQAELWRAGVNMYGVSNLRTFLTSTSGFIRENFRLEFGELPKDEAFLDSISPLREADKIVDPIFVYAGANDPRVPRPESDQIVAATRKKGVPVEYMVKDNEGHSLVRRENQIEFYSRAARFLETQLR